MTALRLLLLEDNPLDAMAIEATLIDDGMSMEMLRVETEAEFVRALENNTFDLILADYSLPGFDGISALEITKTLSPAIPFIFVSATMGEELVIEALKQGATDYVLKHRLGRLTFCIQRALRENQEKRDRQQIATALQQSETRFRLMVASANEYAIFTLNPDSAITTWNGGAERIFGYSEAEILGGETRILYTPEDNERNILQRELETAQEQGHVANERWHLRRDGSRFWGSGFVMPIRNETDEVQGFIKIMRDVTLQRQAEQRLHLLYEVTRDLVTVEQPATLMENLFSKLSPQLELNLYYNYIVEEQNNRPMLHLQSHQGINCELVAAMEWIEFGEYICGQVAQQKQQIVLEQTQIAVDPGAQPIRNAGVSAYICLPLIVQDKLLGTLSFASCTRTSFTPEEIDLLRLMSEQVAVAFDRTNLILSIQQQAEQLRQANQIKDEFLAVLSHELRSPLNPILGWTNMLQKGKLNDLIKRQALEIIERNAKLQSQLIEDLLDISRIMRGKFSLAVTSVNLNFVVSAALETVRLAAEAKHIHLQLNLDTIAPVSGDSARLQQLVGNLLNNAIKFTPLHGQVTVELKQIGQLAQLRVIDTGKGIDPNFLTHVFEYFRQEDSSTTRRFTGLGLGLAIVRQIVEMHGGTVQADSRGENQGATFTVQIPIGNQEIQTFNEPVKSRLENPENPLTNLEILVIDDETDTRNFQAFLLEEYGAKVTAVASGLEALQALDASLPDLIVSDIAMADMDGYTLIQQIRTRSPDRGGNVPAIALTAYAGDNNQRKAMTVGFQAHISKPIEPQQLIQTILNLLN